MDGQKTILLDKLTPFEIFDLLQLANKMRQHEYETTQLLTVQQDPDLQGYDEHRSVHEEGSESSFEVQSEESD